MTVIIGSDHAGFGLKEKCRPHLERKPGLMVKDMGVFSAEDCGGNIKGNRIDIYFDSKSDAKAFGRQGIWIRIMDDNQGQVKLAEIFE